jgi:hypothetical protein
VDDEVYIIQQHPLRLFVALGVRHAQAKRLQSVIYRVGNRLNLARIGSAAHHKVVGECSRILFQLENRNVLGLFILASEDGFIDLAFKVVLFLHRPIDCNPARGGRLRASAEKSGAEGRLSL